MTTSIHRGERLQSARPGPSRLAGGFSMSELVVVISILAVLAAISVTSFNQFLGGGRDALAVHRQEMLNQAVYRFAQQNYEMQFGPMDGSVSDELLVLRSLQYRDPSSYRAQTGSPYFDPRYNPDSSSSTSDYRLRWAGKMFQLLSPGQSGTGLLMNFEGSDFTTAFVFPPDFQTAGR